MHKDDISEEAANLQVQEAIASGVDILITHCVLSEHVLSMAAHEIARQTGKRIMIRNLNDVLCRSERA